MIRLDRPTLQLKIPEDAMPWVGLYISGASLLCTLAMAADAFQGFRHWRLWFPCRFFTINAVTITLIAIAMKLPVDLTAKMVTYTERQAKQVSIYFLVTMLANFLPSLGLMGDKDLLTNIIAFGILIVTITANVLIQSFTVSVYHPVTGILVFIISILLPLSIALIVPTSRRMLEQRYKELHELDSTHHKINFSYKGLIHNVKKHWIMAETGNLQFVITCSPVSYAFGVICLVVATVSLLLFLFHHFGFRVFGIYKSYFYLNHPDALSSDYGWSIDVIVMLQTLGIVLGSIAPIFRCFTAINHFNISRKWSMNHLNVFRVEKFWTIRLKQWKHVRVRSQILGGRLKIVFNIFKNMILNFCIALQWTLVVICKTISLIPKCFLILLTYCWRYLCLPLLKRRKLEQNASESHASSEIEEYVGYVLRFDEESEPSKRLLRNALNSINKLIHQSEKKTSSNLVKLLKKSTGFNGVREFDNSQDPQENQNSWSLVALTLTAIAIALPNIENRAVQELLHGMREGLQFVGHVEENLNANIDDLVKARKASKDLWSELEEYMWLQIDLQKDAYKGQTSKLTLQWLGEIAVEKLKSNKKDSVNQSEHMHIVACSMYRISQTILHRCNEHENWPEDKELFDWISTLIADLLCACFTNLPRVIEKKCHHDAIEKREDSIRAAAQLLGKSKRILEILDSHQLPDIDPDSMAYIDKWNAIPRCQMPNGGASSARIHQGASSSNEPLSVTVM